jgi:alanyl-tRNA synthetase
MTDRLYYTDAYLRTFDARVERVEGGIVTLDRTAFYPTSGGQPFDVGTLNGHRVIDVVDQDDGSIAHVLEAEPTLSRSVEGPGPLVEPLRGLAPGVAVHGEIDWTRRFDHMQQHTGQHMLSAAFDRLFGVRTISFHLGSEASTIDLAREMSAAEIAAAEREANRIVWENRPVAIAFVTPAEAATLPLRKEPARAGTLRVIDIGGFDLSACGGTHVAQTGAIGAIAVSAWERFKGGQRLEFLCGGRAVARLGSLRDAVAAATRLLSVLPAELASAIERLQAEAKEQRRAIVALQNELGRYRAEELAAAGEPVRAKADGSTIVAVLRSVDGDAGALKTLASAVTSKPGRLAVLVTASRPALAVIARSADVQISAQEMLQVLIARFGGRGGGKPELAQGGGLDATADEILSAVRLFL